MKKSGLKKIIISSSILLIIPPSFANTYDAGGGTILGGTDAIAIGERSQAQGNSALATGFTAHAYGDNATAIGANTTATGSNVTAIGNGATATQILDSDGAELFGSAVALGNTAAAVGNSTAVGVSSNANGNSAIAIGESTNSTGNYASALGHKAIANGENATAVGVGANAEGAEATAYGHNANATDSALALGSKASATGNDIALGSDSVAASSQNSNAFLTNTTSSSVVSVGAANTTSRRIQNVADGADDQDAATIKQLKAVNTVFNDVADSLGGNAAYDTTTGTWTPPSYSYTNPSGEVTTANNIGDVLTDFDIRIDYLYSNSTGSAPSNGVTYTDDSKSEIALAGTNGTTISNLNAGAVEQGSKDAVNGDQLNSAYDSMANSFGGGAKFENGTWTAPSYTVGSETDLNLEEALDSLNTANTNLNTRIDNLDREFDRRIDKLNKENKAAVAASIAIASLPQPIEKGTSMVALGTGVWEGETGFSLGASGVTHDKKLFSTPVNYIWKIATTTNSRSTWGGGASIGVQWK